MEKGEWLHNSGSHYVYVCLHVFIVAILKRKEALILLSDKNV